MGGIAIFTALFFGLVLLVDLSWIRTTVTIPSIESHSLSVGTAILLGAALLFVIGVIDDSRGIKPQTKLIGQIVAATFVTFLGYRLHWFESLTLDTLATLFWIVGITNAFNLIDNMDGLCGGVGLVAAVSLAVLFWPAAPEALGAALILAGACAGFLVYNFKPAKIFMGDCGSLVLGFSIGVLALYYSETNPENYLATIAVPVLVLIVPILDTSLVTIIRVLSGRKASTGGRDHTSHRLVLIGFSETRAVLLLYGAGAISGLAAVFVSRSDSLTSPAVIIPLILFIVLMGVYLSQLRVYPQKEFSLLRDHGVVRIVADVTYKKQIVLILLDMIIVAFSYYMAYRLRFDDADFSRYFPVFLKSFPAIIGCKLMIFYALGIYKGFWIYISTSDVFAYVRASLGATLLAVAAVTFAYRFDDFSKGIFLIDWVLTTGLLLGTRGSFRLFVETHKRRTLTGSKVVIYGAGRGGELLLREILNNKQLGVRPIGFVDDDPLKKGKKIQGYSIIGAFDDIGTVHAAKRLEGILISFNDDHEDHAAAHAGARNFCRREGIFLRRFKVNLDEIDTQPT